MLTRFDVRSARVKAIAFHKQRPWVLCGLHNGVIQIWDYRMNTAVDTYTDHAGAVRGVDFHGSQPLFVSGGDDYTVKVWNYKLRRCLYSLSGHADYVRTTFFHSEQPWIVSCSDDFTLRIWNWQNRTCLAVLPGHNHYVMCAQFHPREDLILSVSLDKTIRMWDISALRLRRQEAGLAQDLLGSSDVRVRFELEGHERGINWCSFHPTRPSFVTAAVDRSVRVWRWTDTTCHEEVQLRGHTSDVSCAYYMKDYIVSCSEDRTIRVWDPKQRSSIMMFRRETDRYWILEMLPERNLIAAGHDTGLQVFKLFRERPASTIVSNKTLHYVHENSLISYSFETAQSYRFNMAPHLYPPHTISCNPGDNKAVLWYENDGGCAEVFVVPKPGYPIDTAVHKRASTTGAVFFGPNKFAFVDKKGQLCAFNLQGNREKTLTTDFACRAVFPGPMGCVVCQSEEKVYLYQVAQQGYIAEASVPAIKYVVWDKDFQKVAFLCKNGITVMTRRFRHITTLLEASVRIKSAAFDETRDIMYFTTSNHLKYCNLRTGEVSTISTLKNVVYLVRAVGDKIWAITRTGNVVVRELDNLELTFKLKLQQKAYRDIIQIIQRKELKGQALVGYLHKNGHSEIALHFVTDPFTRFNLALECGALAIAKATATELNKVAVWHRLAQMATHFGDIQLAQFANTKAGNYNSSAMLALITGNAATLGHLIDSTKDNNFKLQYGLHLGDVEQRVQLLVAAGQLPLAYATAKSNGLADVAEKLLASMDPEVAARVATIPAGPATEVAHPTPVTDNWPMLHVEESVFSRLLREPGQFDAIAAPDMEMVEAGAGWGDEDDDLFASAKEGAGANGSAGKDLDDMEEGAGGGWDMDLDIDISAAAPAQTGEAPGAPYVVPRAFPSVTQHWVEAYSIPAFHVAAGSFATAMDLLKRQIGLRNPAPLRDHMMALWAAVNASRPSWLVQSAVLPLATLPPPEEMDGKSAPVLPNYLPMLSEKLRAGYQLFVEGRFGDALATFKAILHQAVLATVKDGEQKASLREMLGVVMQYAQALAIQMHLRSLDPASAESLRVSLYFTHFKLHPTHQALALSQAMAKCYKAKNFKTAASVARRLLDLNPPQNRAKQATAIIAEADRNPTNAVDLDYDERNPFTMCSVTHKPMFRGTVEPIRCSYCLAPAIPSKKGETCPVCEIATIGLDCAGLANHV